MEFANHRPTAAARRKVKLAPNGDPIADLRTLSETVDFARHAAEALFVCAFPLMLLDAVRRAHPVVTPGFLQLSAGRRSGSIEGDDPLSIPSSACLDLTDEPFVLVFPNMAGRRASLTLFDACGRPFANLGRGIQGRIGGQLAVLGPAWRGALPSGSQALRAPTNHVWMVSRIAALSAADLPAAADLALTQRLAPLGEPARAAGRPGAPLEIHIPDLIHAISALDPVAYLHRLTSLTPRAAPIERDAIEAAQRTVIQVLHDPRHRDPWLAAIRDALQRGFGDGLAAIRKRAASRPVSDAGWRRVGDLGPTSDSLSRAAMLLEALGAPAEDESAVWAATRDESLRPLTGAERYRLHFPPGEAPPVDAFWVLTTWPPATSSGADRPSLGDRSGLALEPDGSLHLLIQNEAALGRPLGNGLAAPPGEFELRIHLHWPRPQALNGAWRMPAIERLGSRPPSPDSDPPETSPAPVNFNPEEL